MEGNGIMILLVLLVVYIAIFYFLKMRPDRKRKQEQDEMKRTLSPGDPGGHGRKKNPGVWGGGKNTRL